MDIKQVNLPDRPALPAPRPPQPPEAPKLFERINVLRSLRIHPLASTLVTLLVLGMGLAFLIRHRPVYSASSIIYVSPVFPSTMQPDNEHSYPYDSYVEQQAHAVTRYDVIADAIRNLKNENPAIDWQQPGESEESAVNRLAAAISAKRVGLTYQVEVRMVGGRPEHLAQIVNAVTTSYLRHAKNDEFYGQGVRLDALKEARDKVQTELQAALAEQASISKQLGVAVLSGGNADHLDTQVATLRADLTKAHEQRIEAAAQLSSLEHGGAGNTALNDAADEIIASDPGLVAMKAALNQKRTALLTQLAGLTPNHPLRKQTEQELAGIESELNKMHTDLRGKAAAQLKQKLRTQLRRATTVENQLSADLRASTGEATSAAPKFQRAAQLQAQITDLQSRYSQLDQRTRNLELESTSPGSVHLYSQARTPLGPERSKMKKLGVLLLPVALLLGVGFAVAIDLLDPRIHTAGDMETVLGFSPIGTIFDDQEVTMQAFDECTLRMAAGIDQAARVGNVRTIVFTAIRSGAGTTSIVENLGSTLAKLGRKTLTFDAAGNTPPVAYLTIGMNRPSPKPGAQRESSHTEIQSAEVVTQQLSSQPPPLTSFMDEAFRDLTREYELVLIDATPLLISAETEYLARFADVTIMVAEAGKTKKVDLKRVARLLERINVRGMASVINKVSLVRASQETKRDLDEFESYTNRSNMRWRTGSEPPAGPPGRESGESAGKENPTYA